MEKFIPLSNQKVTDFLNKIIRVAIYIRLSREDGDKEESSSVTNQRSIITRFINEQKNFVVYEEYVDDGWTGANFNRPAFKRMMQDIEDGKIDCVITKDLSRLGRDYIDTGYYVQKFFPEKKIRYIALLDGIDTMQDDGMNDIAPFKSIINDMYIKDISNKIKSVLREKKKSGKFIGTTAPYGYMKDPNNKYQLIIYKDEADVVKYIFDLYLQGNGLTKIAKRLTDEGIPVPGASRNIRQNDKTKLYDCWKQTTISRILKNVVYTGSLEQYKRKNINYKSKVRVVVPKEERILCQNTHEPIISKEVYEHVQELLTGNRSFKGTKHDYLFKGLLYCAECGARLHLSYSNYAFKRYGEYRYTTVCYTYSKNYGLCTRHSNNLKILESLLIENIRKVCKQYINRDLKEELIKAAQEQTERNIRSKQIKTRISELEQKIEELNLCIKNLYIDKVRQVITEKEYMDLAESFRKEQEECNEKLKDLKREACMNMNKKITNTKIEELAKEFVSMEKTTKQLLNELIEKITISEDNIVTIYFKFDELTALSSENEKQMTECKVNKGNTKKVS